MNFQILNQDGTHISYNELDQEAAEFWGVEIDTKWYAQPTHIIHIATPNWHDLIKVAVNNYNHYHYGWKGIVDTLLSVHLKGKNVKGGSDKKSDTFEDISIVQMSAEEFNEIVKFLQPYINLINHWGQKGYQIIFKPQS